MANSDILPSEDMAKPTDTAASIPAERQAPFMQETHPSTTSHEPGELGRAAITEATSGGGKDTTQELDDDPGQ